jgi:hypothetical protein
LLNHGAILIATTTMKSAANAVNRIYTRLPAALEASPRLKSTAKMMQPMRARPNFHISIPFAYSKL